MSPYGPDSEDSEATVQSAWNKEIAERIKAIDEGREKGVALEDVMREADELLSGTPSSGAIKAGPPSLP
jgi:hypothetical protein